jgi:diguanylate cyclase (GGDEF)-like protein
MRYDIRANAGTNAAIIGAPQRQQRQQRIILEHLTTFGDSDYTLKDVQLLCDLPDAKIATLLADCAVVRVAAGETVLDANGKLAQLLIVLRGALQITAATDSSLPDSTMERILPGECVGELSVLDQAANTANVHALHETLLLVIDADKLWKLIDESHGVARNLLRLLSFRLRAANAQSRRRQKVGEFYRQMSMNDALTGLYNRGWLDSLLPTLIDTAAVTCQPLSVVMIDLDHFKRFNDTHGHVAGDEALRQAAHALEATLRPSDYAARYGGEEMIVILPATNQTEAVLVAQRLCERLRQAVVFGDMRLPMPQITASFGVACLLPGQDQLAFIAQADTALYRAKKRGRNQVAC